MSEEPVSRSLDLHGVVCPLNFVKTKLALEELERGAILEVVIDDGESIQNVPRAIKEEGHRIVKVENLSDGRFKLFIKKG